MSSALALSTVPPQAGGSGGGSGSGSVSGGGITRGDFDGEHFDAKAWIKAQLHAGRGAEGSTDGGGSSSSSAVVQTLVMKLQLMSADVQSSLAQASTELFTALPKSEIRIYRDTTAPDTPEHCTLHPEAHLACRVVLCRLVPAVLCCAVLCCAVLRVACQGSARVELAGAETAVFVCLFTLCCLTRTVWTSSSTLRCSSCRPSTR